MSTEEKKAFLLLKSVIFHYHGLDQEEQQLLDEAAQQFDAQAELQWAHDFIAQDYYTAFERSRSFLKEVMCALPEEKRLNYLDSVWQANNKKGYISEMEATAMIKLAKDWHIEKQLIEIIRKNR